MITHGEKKEDKINLIEGFGIKYSQDHYERGIYNDNLLILGL